MSWKPENVIFSSDVVNKVLTETISKQNLEAFEYSILKGIHLTLEDCCAWQEFSRSVRAIYQRYDCVVISGLHPEGDGRSLIAAMSILGKCFLSYGDDQIVKYLAMSPWSRDLARRGDEGFFHTDLNASPSPPALTGIQCITPDPGAPQFGHNRIARIDDILEQLGKDRAHAALYFLTNEEVAMANDRSAGLWQGRLYDNGILRFHPETIRTACDRRGLPAPDMILKAIQRAATKVSEPLSLKQGDILLFSNHRTMHYRSECSVKFNHFPMDFEARKVHILHSRNEREHVTV
ncbi:hypothetical protein GH722_19435 [Alphaproteobacteria bacterium HT1-32]|nr:hypothetical protein [Alphaproteobacteria bacterium HT1-32]